MLPTRSAALGAAVNNETLRCTILERYKDDENLSRGFFRHGLVIDDGCCEAWQLRVQETRTSLPLNHKRPTVDRRFYCDTTRVVICQPLEDIVRTAIENLAGETPYMIYCNKYLRFLEYNRVGSELLPHRDGIKTCEDTGIQSTHTLLLFLSDCRMGGETLIMYDNCDNSHWSRETNLVLAEYGDTASEQPQTTNQHPRQQQQQQQTFNKRRLRYEKETGVSEVPKPATKVFRLTDASCSTDINTNSSYISTTTNRQQPPPRHISVGVQPVKGRILIFPHHWPHAGAMCQSVPKLALRAELTIVPK